MPLRNRPESCPSHIDCIYFDVWLQDDIEVEVAPEQEMPVVARFWDIFAWKDSRREESEVANGAIG